MNPVLLEPSIAIENGPVFNDVTKNKECTINQTGDPGTTRSIVSLSIFKRAPRWLATAMGKLCSTSALATLTSARVTYMPT